MDKTIWINRYHQPLCASRISNRYFMGILVFVATGGGWHNFIAKKKRIQRLFKEGKKRFPKIGPLLNKLEAVAFFVFGFREQVDLPQAHDPETKSLFITAKPKTAVQEQYDSCLFSIRQLFNHCIIDENEARLLCKYCGFTLEDMHLGIYKGTRGKPRYQRGDSVYFYVDEAKKKGVVAIVDAYGTFGQDLEPSYDIFVKEDNTLYKHFRETYVFADIHQA
ncbi:MAG: hypothetical protein IJU64_07185 [Bacilli bacterium]|nr:hypothetical protein [Bacilli bacterium]